MNSNNKNLPKNNRLTAIGPHGHAYFPKCFDKPCEGGGCAIDDCMFMMTVCDKLAAYEDAEEQGRLVMLPCKVGDKLYEIRKNNVLECTAQYFTIGDGAPSVSVTFECDYECDGCPHFSPYTNYEAGDGGCDGEYGDGIIKLDSIGKTVFLTREEAEAALNAEAVPNTED